MSRIRKLQRATASRFADTAERIEVQPDPKDVRAQIMNALDIIHRTKRPSKVDAYWQEGYEPTAEERADFPQVPTFEERFPA